MIERVALADYGCLVISALKEEFETGSEAYRQIRNQILVSKGLVIQKLIIAIRKMDLPTIRWRKERFSEVYDILTPILNVCGLDTEKDISWVPISALNGDNNLKDFTDKNKCN
jgi:peptide chain release factor subunit 3